MFVRSAPFVKTVREWQSLSSRRSADAAARRFAKANMVAIVMRGDDSAVAYLYDVTNDRVARVVHAAPDWVA